MMIHRCLSFMRSQIWIEIQFCKSLIDYIFRKNGHEIFREFFSWLLEGNFEKILKFFIIA